MTADFSSLLPLSVNFKKLYSPESLSNFLILTVLSVNTAEPELLEPPSTPSLSRIEISIVSGLNNLITSFFLLNV